MKKYQINLIPKKKRDLTDTILYFFLHYLRYIIVMTQIVVICVFFFRFQVDQEIIDLKESIDQKQEIIKVTKPLITEANVVDNKIGQIKIILDRQETYLKNVNYIFSIIPAEIVLNRFEIENNTIKLVGISNNTLIIRHFNERLKSEAHYKNVNLTELSKVPTGFSFSINVVAN